MNKILEFVKKHDNLTMIIILLTIITTYMFILELSNTDTLWNFSNMLKMSNGYQMYKDLNIIITPLYFLFGKIFLDIFGKNFLVFLVYQNIIIYMLLFFSQYQLMKKLEIGKLSSIIFITLMAILNVTIMPEGSYNMFAMLFVVLGICNLVNKKQNLLSNIIQGIIAFLVFCTKQNIGILYFIGIAITQLLIEKDKKISIKNILQQGITEWILIILMLLYFKFTNNLYNFFDFCFLGIGEFSNKNLVLPIGNITIWVSIILICITLIVISNIKKIPFEEKVKKRIKILSIMSIAMLFIAYPIFNIAHILICSNIFMILFGYILEIFIFKQFLNNSKIKKVKIAFELIMISVMIIINIIINYKYICKITADSYIFKDNKIYFGAVLRKNEEQEFIEVYNYIKEQKEQGIEIKIISSYADLYNNMFNDNNGIFDLPFYGNMGSEGEKGLIRKIDELKNVKIIIATDESKLHGQEAKNAIKHIKEKYELEREICDFSVYNVK